MPSPQRELWPSSRAACGVPVWQGAQSPRLRHAERPGPDRHPGFAPSRCVGFKIEPRQPPAIPGTDVRLQATKVEKWDEWGAELFSSCLWARSELTTVLCNQPKRRLLDVTPFHRLAEARPGCNVCTTVAARTLGAATTHQPSRAQPQRRAVPERDRPRGKWAQDRSAGVPASQHGISHFVQRPLGGVCCRTSPGWDGMGWQAARDRVAGQG